MQKETSRTSCTKYFSFNKIYRTIAFIISCIGRLDILTLNYFSTAVAPVLKKYKVTQFVEQSLTEKSSGVNYACTQLSTALSLQVVYCSLSEKKIILSFITFSPFWLIT